jgi:hypothetical protein
LFDGQITGSAGHGSTKSPGAMEAPLPEFIEELDATLFNRQRRHDI